MSSVDECLLTLILRSPIHVWVSCGEPYLPSDARRFSRPGQASLVPTQSPARPVVDEQSWLQPSHEELTLDQELHNTETRLAEMEALPEKGHRPLPQKTSQELYHQSDVKRVQVYHSGDRHVSVHV
ncbi:doublecortin domain-containing protein 1-like [Oncorhynchus nerka]|uniref:doublecortin domain-containing protein 1-like n=1 Tax=Oncorhynchus nerka TaxID=8023 RepID=UPI0031B89433